MTEKKISSFRYENKTTRMIAATIGILLAIAGFEHGLFEVFQGNKPTDNLIIQAIGETIRLVGKNITSIHKKTTGEYLDLFPFCSIHMLVHCN